MDWNLQAGSNEEMLTVFTRVAAKITAEAPGVLHFLRLLKVWVRGSKAEAGRAFMQLPAAGASKTEYRRHVLTLTPLLTRVRLRTSRAAIC